MGYAISGQIKTKHFCDSQLKHQQNNQK